MSEATTATAIVMAAGKGTRMKSALPKVLHPIAGRPMIHYPVAAALAAGAADVVVVVGHGREQVERYLAGAFGDRVRIAVQEEQRGTGHAVLSALPSLGATSNRPVLILSGDTPLLGEAELRRLLSIAREAATAPLALLTATLDDATGYGRVVREGGRVVAIVEQKDATAEQRALREWNPAVYAIRHDFLAKHVPNLGTSNAQGEMYLTDLVAIAAREGGVVDGPVEASSVEGINDRAQLAALDRRMLAAIARRHQLAGVTVRDPASVEIHDGVVIGQDAVIERGVVLRGKTSIGARSTVDVGCVLTDVEVADEVTVKPYSVLTESRVGARAQIGPFTHLRPASDVGPEAHVGNFVELKKTKLGPRSKANHLAYLGDGMVGSDVNVGAGTIFCNYDGVNKHVTTLEDGAFIGSDSQLVAPITIGKGAYVGTGTTVTRDVPAGALAIGRAKQENKEGYAERIRGRLRAIAAAKKAEKSG
jgi:bifunctional UDP-N-acetylglucosamine pyrophosphorylase/glucosamine-1-phosphate N-acetyltransferase